MISSSPGLSATVYIWGTKFVEPDSKEDESTVGHVSIKIEDSSQNMHYFSLRPKSTGSIFLPSRGEVASSEKDNEYDGSPSEVFRLAITEEQSAKMCVKMNFLSERIESGKLCYQLTPGASILSPLKRIFQSIAFYEQMSRCPVSELPLNNDYYREQYKNDMSEAKELAVSHCALSVTQILRAGGYSVPTSQTPWKITPSELGVRVSHFEKASKVAIDRLAE